MLTDKTILTSAHTTDSHTQTWLHRMIDAGWRFAPWTWGNDILFRHADEYGAAITVAEAYVWLVQFCNTLAIPDPYDVMRRFGERE